MCFPLRHLYFLLLTKKQKEAGDWASQGYHIPESPLPHFPGAVALSGHSPSVEPLWTIFLLPSCFLKDHPWTWSSTSQQGHPVCYSLVPKEQLQPRIENQEHKPTAPPHPQYFLPTTEARVLWGHTDSVWTSSSYVHCLPATLALSHSHTGKSSQ